VEGHSVIQRLNEALEGAWSFEIVHHEVREDEGLVLAKLSAEGLVKMNFGVSQVTRERDSGAGVSLGDDFKAAATDALKKCATFPCVGLHLYADKPPPPAPAPTPTPPAREPVSDTRPGPNGRPRAEPPAQWPPHRHHHAAPAPRDLEGGAGEGPRPERRGAHELPAARWRP
jgi:hypothetical protein